MIIHVDRAVADALGFDLAAAVAEFAAARAAHAETEGEPAPVAHPLVERIVVTGGAFEIVEPPEPEPVPETPPTLSGFRLAIQAHIDAAAASRSYDSGVTCASYLGSTVPAWAAEAAAFVAWRDAVWAHAYLELAKVEAGTRETPTIAGFLGELPEPAWPG